MAIKNRKNQTPEDSAVTLVGRHAAFEGDLKFYGTVQIDGKFKGTLSGDGTVIVGEHGVLEAEIHVPHVIIFGEVNGDVIAEEKIDLRESGKVEGNIQSPVIRIAPGAIFKGSCKTQQVKDVDNKETTMIKSLKRGKIQNVALLATAF
ncbi:MAG: polymer-forming cytoskeletal protein [Desulfobacterales bacterium]